MSYGTQLADRKRTDYIVVHTAETFADQNIGAADIDRWHRSQGWACIGYHGVIRRNGAFEQGRAWDAIGAQVQHHNFDSVGIALAGGLRFVADTEKATFDEAVIAGKREMAGTYLDPKRVRGPSAKGIAIYDANYTPAQLSTLRDTITMLLRKYPGAVVLGHRDLAGDKRPCPVFDVKPWFAADMPLTVTTSLL